MIGRAELGTKIRDRAERTLPIARSRAVRSALAKRRGALHGSDRARALQKASP